MNAFNFPVSETVLLTGAGFTHNIGGFLAKAMWAEIHNNFLRHYGDSDNDRIIAQIKGIFDYEDLYQSICDSDEYPTEQKEAFQKAVLNAYDTLDRIVCSYKNKLINETNNINISELGKFFQLLKGTGKEHGFFFTLNQDIFIERYFTEGPNGPVCPGIKTDSRFNIGANKKLDAMDLRIVPRNQELEKTKTAFKKIRERLHYIKLHGSYDWRDEQNHAKMVIGTNKSILIKKEPVLSWYFQLFDEVLSLDNRRLLMIGYGFRDPHINEIIMNAVTRHKLKIYMIHPCDSKTLKERMSAIHIDLWNAMEYHCPHPLEQIFPRRSTVVGMF